MIVIVQSAMNVPVPEAANGWRSPELNPRMAGAVSDRTTWARTIDRVRKLQSVLLRCDFECLDWKVLLDRFSKRKGYEKYLIFCDPPYRATSHYYPGEFDHDDFINTIRSSPMMIVVMESSDESLPALRDAGWQSLPCSESRQNGTNKSTARLWYSPAAMDAKLDLFSIRQGE